MKLLVYLILMVIALLSGGVYVYLATHDEMKTSPRYRQAADWLQHAKEAAARMYSQAWTKVAGGFTGIANYARKLAHTERPQTT